MEIENPVGRGEGSADKSRELLGVPMDVHRAPQYAEEFAVVIILNCQIYLFMVKSDMIN